jgi:hypothetical protein
MIDCNTLPKELNIEFNNKIKYKFFKLLIINIFKNFLMTKEDEDV